MIEQIVWCATGALIASGLLALGFFIGLRAGKARSRTFRRVTPVEDGLGPEAQQEAFETLMRYGVDDAYGGKGARR